MKSLLALALVSSISLSFARENTCKTKQENVAIFDLAQKIGTSVHKVEVVSYTPGVWTEAAAENHGSDIVTVRTENRTNSGITVKSFQVFVKQIGATSDCKILSKKEVKTKY